MDGFNYHDRDTRMGRKSPFYSESEYTHSPHQITDITGYHVALLSNVGEMRMCTSWIPNRPEGKYTFSSEKAGKVAEHIYFEAVNGEWVIQCIRPARFKIMDSQYVKYVQTQKLIDQSLYTVELAEQKYIIYSEATNKQSSVFHNYFVNSNTDITIGRTQYNDIIYPNKRVSHFHAVIRWKQNGWKVVDQTSSNGTFANGKKITEKELKIGDSIYILGLQIILGIGFISINDGNERVFFNSTKLHQVKMNHNADVEGQKAEGENNTKLFNRFPRKRESLNAPPISIEAPPISLNSNNIPLLLRMGSPLVMSSTSLLAGNITSMLSSVLFPVLTQKYTEKQKKEYEERRYSKYGAYLSAKADEIDREVRREEQVLNANYPELAQVLAFPDTEKRLWERRKTDDDFASLRLGYGQLPMIAECDYPERNFEIDDDALLEEMFKLAESPKLISHVPIMSSFVDDYVCGVLGKRRIALQFVISMIVQLSLLHSYDEMKIMVLIEPKELKHLDFIRYLPHLWTDQKDFRFLATNNHEASQISEYLTRELGNSLEKKQELKEVLKSRPYYFIFALDKKIFDSMEILKDIIQSEQNCGFSVLTVFDDLPKECTKIFDLHESGHHSVIHLNNPEKADDFFTLDPIKPTAAMDAMRKISNINLKMLSQAYSLPKMISFLEMYGVGRVEHLNPIKRWRENNPVKSLAVPIGVDTDGSLFTLDLHEKYQGPHGLVAGTTGSGKSEFIITYILSMAVNFHPDEVAFILIDYKGGGLAGAFEDKNRGIHLPHLVGTITNLDGAAIQRSLMSIQSELMRRQRIFNEAKSLSNEGTMDIYTYQRLYRNKQVSEPVPHLFIISDEFAELKSQEPEFMDQLISAARIGRSLGVHLILATQKPAGVVNDQIWSNTKFRVCLKVQDRGDSFEMLKRPEASELKNTGRFYLQVGNNEFFGLGQSAWCGANYFPQDEVVIQKDDELQFIDYVGQVVAQSRPKVEVKNAGIKQIVAIVKYLSDLAEREGIHPRSLWKEPLPKFIGIDEATEEYGIQKSDVIQVPLGIVDDPFRQSQYPLLLNLQEIRNFLVVGTSGSGKTTMLQTILYAASCNYTPEQINYYILDFSSRNLTAFRKLPHCGAVLLEENEGEIEQVLSLMERKLDERKKLFSEAEVSSYDSYIRISPLPMILLVVDNLTAMNEFKEGRNMVERITNIMRNGVSYGIKVMASVSNVNDCFYRMLKEIGYFIALQANDRHSYSNILNVHCQYEPPHFAGRGMCVIDGEAREMQVLLPVQSEDEQMRSNMMRQRLNEVISKWHSGLRAEQIAVGQEESIQDFDEFCSIFERERIPLGKNLVTGKNVAMPLQQLDMMSVYIGNHQAEKLVLKNLLTAFHYNGMQIKIVRCLGNSIFDGKQIPENLLQNVEFYDCNLTSIQKLTDDLVILVQERTVLRQNICQKYDIGNEQEDWTNQEALKLWRKDMRKQTQPVMVVYESFADFELTANLVTNEACKIIWKMMTGYNVYFCSVFRPEDSKRLEDALICDSADTSEEPNQKIHLKERKIILQDMGKAFNPEQFILMFGGRFDAQELVRLSSEYRKITQPFKLADCGKFLLHYKNEVAALEMPLGELPVQTEDADEASIL
jgi:S-DNA-T family DNA segregation ATPase FtsK/SpoIIIE